MKPLFSCTFFAGLFSVLVFSSCERAAVQSSFVSLQLPSISDSGQIQKTGEAFSCNTCLKAFVVQASGAGFDPIRQNRFDGNMDLSGLQLNGDIIMEVPIGSQRHFQILALYRNADGMMKIYYGSSYEDLNAEASKVEIKLNLVGSMGAALWAAI